MNKYLINMDKFSIYVSISVILGFILFLIIIIFKKDKKRIFEKMKYFSFGSIMVYVFWRSINIIFHNINPNDMEDYMILPILIIAIFLILLKLNISITNRKNDND